MMDERSSEVESQQTIALVHGQILTKVPDDLYIPPEALQVFLEAFEGPLDLLLYLIKKQNLDILNIRVAEVSRQYVEYVELMQELNFELAAEYLVMAAFLTEIKSRLLLPRQPAVEAEDDDPRATLIRKLQEYERFKKAAEDLDSMPRVERDVFMATPEIPETQVVKIHPNIDFKEVLLALATVLRRASLSRNHHIKLEPLSIRERMTEVLSKVSGDQFVDFSNLFTIEEGRAGVVVTFIAILELIKQSLIDFVQAQPYAPIHVRATSN